MQFPAIPQSPKDAVRSVQHLLNILAPATGVAVDGVVGKQTRAVYNGLPASLQEAVKGLAITRNPLAYGALTAKPVPRTPSGRRISHDEAVLLAERALSKHGQLPVDGVTSLQLMEFLLTLEPLGNKRDGYVIESVSPSGNHLGIYQMGYPAWQDVQETRRMPQGLTWRATCFDPQLATEAAVIYLRLTATRLRSSATVRGGTRVVPPVRGPLTKEILYAAYNQGAVGFRLGAPDLKAQSSLGQQVVLTALQQAGIARV